MRVKPLERFETEERCRRVVDPLASPIAGDGEVPVEARNRSEGEVSCDGPPIQEHSTTPEARHVHWPELDRCAE